MTSRTIDIHCSTCRKYLHSLQYTDKIPDTTFCCKACEENYVKPEIVPSKSYFDPWEQFGNGQITIKPFKYEQKLIDIMFQIAQASAEHMHGKTQEEICTWVTEQLKDCGFETKPVGSSWGVLQNVR